MSKADLETSLGNNCYKIRLAIKSKGRGKSGGARIITYLNSLTFKNEDITYIILLSIYDKSDLSSLPDYLIKHLVQEIKIKLGNIQ